MLTLNDVGASIWFPLFFFFLLGRFVIDDGLAIQQGSDDGCASLSCSVPSRSETIGAGRWDGCVAMAHNGRMVGAGRRRIRSATERRTKAAQQVIEMLTESSRNAIQSDGVDARIDVRQTKAQNLNLIIS